MEPQNEHEVNNFNPDYEGGADLAEENTQDQPVETVIEDEDTVIPEVEETQEENTQDQTVETVIEDEDTVIPEVEETQEEPVEETPVDTANYKIIGHSQVYDKMGNIKAPLAIGSVIEFPVEYGDELVQQGVAEKVVEESNEEEE